MNNLILASALRAITMIGSSILVGKGLATSAEVSDAVTNGTTAISALIAVGTAAYSVWTRFTAQQVKMTNSISTVVQPAVAKKK